MADQFLRLKRGDRYFYDLGGQAGSFTEGLIFRFHDDIPVLFFTTFLYFVEQINFMKSARPVWPVLCVTTVM